MELFGRLCFPRVSLPLAMLSALVFAGAVQASVLTPGPGASLPDLFTLSGSTLLASTTLAWTSSTSTMSGSYEAAVYSDPGNTFGAGNLDFVYQISNNAGSTDSVGRVTAINFTSWSTDIGYVAAGSTLGSGFVDGTVAPELVDRVSPGDSVGFSFNAPLTTLIAPGETSTVLVIETNATSYTTGYLTIIDGGATTMAAYGPAGAVTPTVPEPASMLLIGGGLLSLAGIARFRRAR